MIVLEGCVPGLLNADEVFDCAAMWGEAGLVGGYPTVLIAEVLKAGAHNGFENFSGDWCEADRSEGIGCAGGFGLHERFDFGDGPGAGVLALFPAALE